MIKKEIKLIAEAMLEKKAENVLALDLRPIGTSISDFFVVCNAQSTSQVRAIADNIEEQLIVKLNKKPVRKQGTENGIWVILDYGSEAVVHIFQTEYRNFYRLEDLWADAPQKTYKLRKKAKKTNEQEAEED